MSKIQNQNRKQESTSEIADKLPLSNFIQYFESGQGRAGQRGRGR